MTGAAPVRGLPAAVCRHAWSIDLASPPGGILIVSCARCGQRREVGPRAA